MLASAVSKAKLNFVDMTAAVITGVNAVGVICVTARLLTILSFGIELLQLNGVISRHP